MQQYHIHDNHGRPFIVEYQADNPIKIYTDIRDDYKLLMTINTYEKFYAGIDTNPDSVHGNTILIHLESNIYMYIGSEIYLFETIDNELITNYVSAIGNNDVPYPYAVGTNNTYFMLEYSYVSNNIIGKSDPFTYPYKDNNLKALELFQHRILVK